MCYNYSGDGRRVYCKDEEHAFYHQYDGDQVICDLDGTGTAVAFYGRTPDGRLAYSVQRSLTYRYHQDALGSVALVSADGQAVASYTYDEFGGILEESVDLYAYARDNPVNHVDPSGMREAWEAGVLRACPAARVDRLAGGAYLVVTDDRPPRQEGVPTPGTQGQVAAGGGVRRRGGTPAPLRQRED